MKGLEPSTFCMASRRSSQLSYIRATAPSIAGRMGLAGATVQSRDGGLSNSAAVAVAAAPSRGRRRLAVESAAAPASGAVPEPARRADVLDHRPVAAGGQLPRRDVAGVRARTRGADS